VAGRHLLPMCLVSLGRTGQIGGLRPPGEMAPTKKILRTAYGSPASACRKRVRTPAPSRLAVG